MRVSVRVGVGVFERVPVAVAVGVRVIVGVRVTVGVREAVGVRETVGVGVMVGVFVRVGVVVGVTVTGPGGVGVVVPRKTNRTASAPTNRFAIVADSSWVRLVSSTYSSPAPVKLYLPIYTHPSVM